MKAKNPVVLHESRWQESDFRWTDPNEPAKRRLLSAVLGSEGLTRLLSILDFGCGDGLMAGYLSSKGHHVTGVDISPTALSQARASHGAIPFLLIDDGSSLPFRSESFDLVYSSEVIEHVYDSAFLFAEWKRVLRKGGLLIVTTPYHGLLKNLIVAAFYFDRHFDPMGQHIRFWTRRSLTHALASQGMVPLRFARIGRIAPLAKSLFAAFKRADHP